MGDERLRLRKLIEHWAEHNDEHRARFEASAREAEKMGMVKVAENLMLAAKEATNVSSYLREAIKGFE